MLINQAGKYMDLVTDMLNRIKNAQAVLHPQVTLPFSNLKYAIAKILEKKGFIEKAAKVGKKSKKFIEIILKYSDKTGAISGMRKISKPGQRIYLSAKELKQVKGGYGIAIVSTSKGLMTGQEAKRQKLGGELICEVW